MGKIIGRLWEKAQQYDSDELKDQSPHSHAYHAYFRGYSEWKVPRKNGKGYRIERLYTADYHKYAETDLMWRGKKLYYLTAYLAAVGIYIIGASQASALNSTMPIGIAEVLSLLSLAYLGYSLVFQLLAKRHMTEGEYLSASIHLKWGALVSACLAAFVSVLMLILQCFTGFHWDINDISAFGSLLGTAFVCFILYQMEAMRSTERIKNNNVTPKDANEIW